MAEVWGVPEDSDPEAPANRPSSCWIRSVRTTACAPCFVFGSNVLVSAPGRAADRSSAFESLDLLVVSDFFLSETAALADVVLPERAMGGRGGDDDQPRRAGCAAPPRASSRRRGRPHRSRDDRRPRGAAGHVGAGSRSAASGDVFDELRRASERRPRRLLRASPIDRIDAEDGVFWPCPAIDHPGTPRLFADRFPTAGGRARFHAVPHQPPAEDRDADYPLYLTTGRVLAQYQSGTQTRRVREAAGRWRLSRSPRLHPLTARRLGVADERVRDARPPVAARAASRSR